MKKLSEYFKLTKLKVVLFLIIFVLALSTISSPWCVGPQCNYGLYKKIIYFAPQMLLPGLTNLFRENAFFIGQKTHDLGDAIPQLIFHVGIDLIYLYTLICIISYIIKRQRKYS